jgi:hydrogenase maturation protein HypF
MGRLFDAVAALIGVRQMVSYEAQAAIEMEALCDTSVTEAYAFDVSGDMLMQIDPSPLLNAVVRDLKLGLPASAIAMKLHRAVANVTTELCVRARKAHAVHVVALSGGVFQNVQLLSLCMTQLRAQGFEALTNRRVPPNDGGLALGQATLARYIV